MLYQKICYICKEKFEDKIAKDKKYKDKKYCKVTNNCHYTDEYRGSADSIYNLTFSVPKEILILFHNGSSYLIFSL